VSKSSERKIQFAAQTSRMKILCFALLLLFIILLKCLDTLGLFEYAWLDRLFSIRYTIQAKSLEAQGTKSLESPVMIVAVPSLEERLSKYKDHASLRAAYVKALNILNKNDAKVIAINLLPTSSETEGLKSSDLPPGYKKSSVVIPLIFMRTGRELSIIASPDANLKKLADTAGLVEIGSNVNMRWFTVEETIGGQQYRHFLVQILLQYFDVQEKDLKLSSSVAGSEMMLGRKKKIALQKKNLYFINYITPSTAGKKSSPAFSFHRLDQILNNEVSAKDIKGKIVIFGSVDPVDRYFHLTPLGFISDSEIYGQALYSMLKGQSLTYIPTVFYIVILLALAVGCYVLFLQNPLEGRPLLFAGLLAGYLIANVALFTFASLYLDILPFLLLIAGTIFLRTYFSADTQQEQLEHHIEAFKTIVERSLRESESPDWGNTLLTLICQPLKINRGVLVLFRDDKMGPEGRELYCYPLTDNPKTAIFEEEIEAMLRVKKTIIAPSSLVVPLTQGTESKLFGVLKLQKKSFNQMELQMMMVLAHLTFISMYNVRLTEKVKDSERLHIEAELASKIQKALLSEKPPQFRGVSVAARCIPASEVGGDYLDFVTTQDGVAGIAIGDVTGHGMGAAIIMGLLRSVLRAQSTQSSSPAEVVSAINNVLYSDFVSFSKMASLFYCTYSVVDKTLTFTNAGQNPPLLIRASELNARPLKGKGPILGFRPNIKYKEFRIKIYPGDIIVFMTDGIVESENAEKEFFGVERVEKIVNDFVDSSAEEIVEKLISEVEEFTGGLPQKDDMTLIVMKL